MERKIVNLELKKSGNFCFYLCKFQIQSALFFLVFAVNFGSGLSGLGIENYKLHNS